MLIRLHGFGQLRLSLDTLTDPDVCLMAKMQFLKYTVVNSFDLTESKCCKRYDLMLFF